MDWGVKSSALRKASTFLIKHLLKNHETSEHAKERELRDGRNEILSMHFILSLEFTKFCLPFPEE
jgi:hypothetical protein